MKLKEVKFRPRTEAHDLEHKMKRVVQFLEAGDRVRLVVTYRGREMAHPEVGERLLDRLVALAPGKTFVGPYRTEGRTLSVELRYRG